MKQDEKKLSEGLKEAAEKCEAYYDVGEEHGYLCTHRGDIKDAFIAGAEWQKAKMMEGAVEGEVYLYNGYKREAIAILVDIPKDKLGDKVKVIFIKEDEK